PRRLFNTTSRVIPIVRRAITLIALLDHIACCIVLPLLSKQIISRMTTLRSVPRTTANRVISEMTGQLALRSQHLPMQIITFHVRDRSTVNADLVHVSRPVMQPIDRALARDRGADAISKLGTYARTSPARCTL
ncbi:hypothetical protein GQ56_0138810, partial [Burkholderia paludis]